MVRDFGLSRTVGGSGKFVLLVRSVMLVQECPVMLRVAGARYSHDVPTCTNHTPSVKLVSEQGVDDRLLVKQQWDSVHPPSSYPTI